MYFRASFLLSEASVSGLSCAGNLGTGYCSPSVYPVSTGCVRGGPPFLSPSVTSDPGATRGPQPGQPPAYADSVCARKTSLANLHWLWKAPFSPKYVSELVQRPPSPQLLLLGPRAIESNFTWSSHPSFSVKRRSSDALYLKKKKEKKRVL